MLEDMIIAIHAPAKGATPTRDGTSAVPLDFNPRSREGSDILPEIATCIPWHFNPRSREGSDRVASASDREPSIFQSTLPRRERLDSTGK